jgi:trans-aconitate 2-methyltransferase
MGRPSGGTSNARYTYGDSAFAADRLDLLARVLEPSSRAFLERAGPARPSVALDLGCGPGNTTRLIADVLRSERTVGLDRSSSFIDRARDHAPTRVVFMEHDVTLTPFPVAPADILFSRLVIAHLHDREELIARWATQLAPRGVLLLEEIDHVRSDEPAFVEYLALAIEVVGRAGGRLVAGPEIAAMPDPPGTDRTTDDVRSVDITSADAAAIFGMNLQVLVERGELEPQPALVRALADLATNGGAPVDWKMRQIAFRRREGSG